MEYKYNNYAKFHTYVDMTPGHELEVIIFCIETNKAEELQEYFKRTSSLGRSHLTISETYFIHETMKKHKNPIIEQIVDKVYPTIKEFSLHDSIRNFSFDLVSYLEFFNLIPILIHHGLLDECEKYIRKIYKEYNLILGKIIDVACSQLIEYPEGHTIINNIYDIIKDSHLPVEVLDVLNKPGSGAQWREQSEKVKKMEAKLGWN